MLYDNDIVRQIERNQVSFLAYSFLYYIHDITVVPDSFYDNLCSWLYRDMQLPEAKETRFYELCKDLDSSGSGFYLKEEDYPSYIVMVAYKLYLQSKEKREITLEELENYLPVKWE